MVDSRVEVYMVVCRGTWSTAGRDGRQRDMVDGYLWSTEDRCERRVMIKGWTCSTEGGANTVVNAFAGGCWGSVTAAVKAPSSYVITQRIGLSDYFTREVLSLARG